MTKKLRLEIVTPDRIAYSDDIKSLVVRAIDGDIGILYNHAPLIGILKEWPAKLNMLDGSVKFINVVGGFIEVKSNNITILAPTAELPEEIDAKRAEAAKQRAKGRLSIPVAKDIDIERAEAALRRALSRLAAVELVRRR